MSYYNEALQKLIAARAALAKAKAHEDKIRRYLEQQEAFKDFLAAQESRRNAEVAEKAAKVDLAKAALELYSETGEKKLPGGVAIKNYKKVMLDEAEATAWAIEHKMFDILTVQKKSAEALAKAGALPENVARVVDEPRAFIPKSLG